MAYVPPRAGEFRQTFSVERRTDVKDGVGGDQVTWVSYLPKVYAAVREERGDEQVKAARLSGISRYDIVLRASKDAKAITSRDKLVKTVTKTVFPEILTQNYDFASGNTGYTDSYASNDNYTGTSNLPSSVLNYQGTANAVQAVNANKNARGTIIPFNPVRTYRLRSRYFVTATSTIRFGVIGFIANGNSSGQQNVNITAPTLNTWVDFSMTVTAANFPTVGGNVVGRIAPFAILNLGSASAVTQTIDYLYLEDITDAGETITRTDYNIKWVGDVEGRGRFLNLFCETGGLTDAS